MNLNKEEREALDGLIKDRNVVIVPADKGSCLVVLNREDYDQKCKSLLDDTKTYKPLGYNPTNGFRKKVCTFINTIYTKGTIKIDLKRKLDPPSEPSVPAFYFTAFLKYTSQNPFHSGQLSVVLVLSRTT